MKDHPRDRQRDTSADVAPTEPMPENGAGTLATPESAKPEHAAARKEHSPGVTRAGVLWTATIAGLLFLVLLIVLIAQNQDQVVLRYFTYEGNVSLGLALFIAAVSGGILVAIAGAARIMQLRASERKQRRLGRK